MKENQHIRKLASVFFLINLISAFMSLLAAAYVGAEIALIVFTVLALSLPVAIQYVFLKEENKQKSKTSH